MEVGPTLSERLSRLSHTVHILRNPLSIISTGSFLRKHGDSLFDKQSFPSRRTSDPISFTQISAINQSQFILDAREALNRYNQQTNTDVKSLPLSQLFIVTSKAETSLGSVSWSISNRILSHRLDLGKETISFYIEVKLSEEETPELQLLSVR